mgnify:CR=1 FL=1
MISTSPMGPGFFIFFNKKRPEKSLNATPAVPVSRIKEDDEEILSKNYTAPLLQQVSGMRWYLKMQTQNTDLFCAMQSVIHDIAMAHARPYYKNIVLEEGCR